MNCYAETSYKNILRTRVKELNLQGKRLTLKKIAEKIPIQYTYLSKALNDEDTHLNEDHLFVMGNLLELYPEELEYVCLLRAYETAREPLRRQHVQARLEHLRKEKQLRASLQSHDRDKLEREMAFLFDPLCILVHVSLFVEAYAKEPRKLCPILGITFQQLRSILRKLQQLEYLELSENGGEVLSVNHGHIHYSTEHPLMRVHQALLRSVSATQLLKTDEEDKHSFMVTFSSDAETTRKVKEAFQVFLKQVEPLIVNSPSKGAYQMNFDLFKWA